MFVAYGECKSQRVRHDEEYKFWTCFLGRDDVPYIGLHKDQEASMKVVREHSDENDFEKIVDLEDCQMFVRKGHVSETFSTDSGKTMIEKTTARTSIKRLGKASFKF